MNALKTGQKHAPPPPPHPSVLVDFHTAWDQPGTGWLPQTTRLLLCFGFHPYERPSELTQVVKFKK